MMRRLVEKCDGRITRIENRSPVNTVRNGDVIKLIEMIETLSCNGRRFYLYEVIDRHERDVEHLQRYNPAWTLQEELSVLVLSLSRVLPEDVWKVILEGGMLLATVSAVGIAGYGAVVGGTAAVTAIRAGALNGLIGGVGRALTAFVSRFRYW